jgi:hypothetical protein
MSPSDKWKECDSGEFKSIHGETILHIANYHDLFRWNKCAKTSLQTLLRNNKIKIDPLQFNIFWYSGQIKRSKTHGCGIHINSVWSSIRKGLSIRIIMSPIKLQHGLSALFGCQRE